MHVLRGAEKIRYPKSEQKIKYNFVRSKFFLAKNIYLCILVWGNILFIIPSHTLINRLSLHTVYEGTISQ